MTHDTPPAGSLTTGSTPPRSLLVEPYVEQIARWPREGRHLMAQYNETSIVLYQAYRPSIGTWSAQMGRLGGPGFSQSRMTWVKPNFLWMMFRSGWGTKPDQEVTLAIHVKREWFEAILAEAVPSSHAHPGFSDEAAWQAAVARSDVRLQWDPDHLPSGGRCERRAVQLGIRGEALLRLNSSGILEIEDISSFVATQRQFAQAPYRGLITPREEPFVPTTVGIRAQIGLDP